MWQDDAECFRRNIDPEAFFPKVGEAPDPRAVSACAVCPVSFECLQFAMDHERPIAGKPSDRTGIWGGYSERARLRIAAGESPRPIFDARQIVEDRRKARYASRSYRRAS